MIGVIPGQETPRSIAQWTVANAVPHTWVDSVEITIPLRISMPLSPDERTP